MIIVDLSKMWSHVPFDLLSTIFSFLPPDSLVRVTSVCRHWQACATSTPIPFPPNYTIQPPWFLALPTRIDPALPCFAHNPATARWHQLNLDSTLLSHSHPARPITTISGLILLRLTSTTTLRLSVLNPFTRKSTRLPELLIPRTNPAVGLVDLRDDRNPSPRFQIYVAGGMLDGSATYEPTMEMYDSWTNKWEAIGKIPVEYAVRLTVWTPNESTLAKGVLYWMTSARAYSVMGIEIGTNRWMEQSVPMAERLEFAALVRRRGRLTVVGGESGMGACAWELSDGGVGWRVTGKVPSELGVRLVGREGNWVGVKCVGIEGAVWLYKGEEMGRPGGGMVVWREVDGGGGGGGGGRTWEWSWVEAYGLVQGSNFQFPMKGFLIHPNLSPICI